jgi:hypothetical protein
VRRRVLKMHSSWQYLSRKFEAAYSLHWLVWPRLAWFGQAWLLTSCALPRTQQQGLVVERVSGRRYGRLLEDEIWAGLGCEEDAVRPKNDLLA